jgi:two-component system LytT family response regulator
MTKILIIEDENKARKAIVNIIKSNIKDVEILDKAEDVQSGLSAIILEKPDIVLLDINLGNGSGFDILKQLPKINFKLIFLTAYQEYAIKAIKFSALDYILKPFDPYELISAIERAKTEIVDQNNSLKIETFLANFENIKKEIKKIVLKTSDSIHIVNVQNIIRCEADNNYTNFHLNDNKKILVTNTLKEYEEMLSPYNFMRVHQSHLINVNYISRFDKKDGGYVVMSDKSNIPVSSRKRQILLDMFDKM